MEAYCGSSWLPQLLHARTLRDWRYAGTLRRDIFASATLKGTGELFSVRRRDKNASGYLIMSTECAAISAPIALNLRALPITAHILTRGISRLHINTFLVIIVNKIQIPNNQQCILYRSLSRTGHIPF